MAAEAAHPAPEVVRNSFSLLDLTAIGYRCRLGMTVYETTNHQTIYHWATSNGLWPACVAGAPDRIRLGGDPDANPGEAIEPIEWWRWFQEFDRRNLQLIYDPSKGWFTLGSRLAPSSA